MIAIVAQLLLSMALLSAGVRQAEVRNSTVDEIKAEFASVPCRNEDRLSAAKTLFEKMGVASSDLSVANYRNVENLVVRKQGSSTEIIVIGAHFDKVPEGCGAIDNWTGIVTVAHLYRALKDMPTQKTFLFVAFGKEEKGLIGSRAMVSALDKIQASHFCEMLNIDSLGLAAPQVLDNVSSARLTQLAAQTAKDLQIKFAHAAIANTDADSSSFKAKGIPALTIHGMNNDWSTILHTRNDQVEKVNAFSVYLGYRLMLAMALRLDSSACSEYR